MNTTINDPKVFGFLAEFEQPEQLVAAARNASEKGYRKVEAYSPFPIDGLSEAIGIRRNRVAAIVLVGGIVGGLSGFAMQWFSAVIHYPIDVGGRPFNSWPAFIPITFEMTILSAALSAVIGMLGLNGLPRLNHPMFNVPGFARASGDRFFLCIEATDPLFDPDEVVRFLEDQQPHAIAVVPLD
jgi:hypothetical protein